MVIIGCGKVIKEYFLCKLAWIIEMFNKKLAFIKIDCIFFFEMSQ